MLGAPAADVHAWRKSRYSEKDPENSEARFLLEYDVGYRQRRLRFLLNKTSDPGMRRELARIAATLKKPGVERLREVFIRAAADTEACLDAEARRYFDRFELYDQLTFPVFYEASMGETEVCEVFRISPRDATGETRGKLAGATFFHFGAFLSRFWRENDLKWGRLDGAERIIRAVLPADSPDAEMLVREARLAIGEIPGDIPRKLPLFSRAVLVVCAGWTLLRMTLATASERRWPMRWRALSSSR
jgi:hypothetical protein